jgi:hypothetical protein
MMRGSDLGDLGDLGSLRDEGLAPWERQPGEPMLWFARFERYRLMGAGRSLLALYRWERSGMNGRGATGSGGARTIPNAWRRAAERWRWRERAEAWDAHVLARERAEEEDIRRRARAAQLAALTELQERLRQALAEFDPRQNPPGWRDFAAVMRAVGDEMRALFDEAPRQRHELSGPGGEPLVPLDLLAELAARALDRDGEDGDVAIGGIGE